MTSLQFNMNVLFLIFLSIKFITSAPIGCFSDCMNEALFDYRYHTNITEIFRAHGHKQDECTKRCFPQFERSENPGLDRFYMPQRPFNDLEYKRYHHERYGGNEETFFTMKVMLPISIVLVAVIGLVRKFT
ncbi:hypothetical protein ACFFRR_009290 [Megaselia abdita]